MLQNLENKFVNARNPYKSELGRKERVEQDNFIQNQFEIHKLKN